jgi:uncharacterized phage protein (TIGR02220 family)
MLYQRRGEESREETEKTIVERAFDYWHSKMQKLPSVKLTAKRKTKITTRLSNGYTIEDIKTAIDNCSKSAFHMGENDRKTKYNDIELICRSDEKLESFRDMVNNGTDPSGPTAREIAKDHCWHDSI